MVLFSLWDYDSSSKTAYGASPWCGRFDNEGQGAHCGLQYVFEFGLEYRFELTRAAKASGVTWSTTVAKVDPIGTETKTFIGSIFVNGAGLGEDCTEIQPVA